MGTWVRCPAAVRRMATRSFTCAWGCILFTPLKKEGMEGVVQSFFFFFFFPCNFVIFLHFHFQGLGMKALSLALTTGRRGGITIPYLPPYFGTIFYL